MMKRFNAKLSQLFKKLKQEQGQDLVEYALLVALIAFAAVAGVKTLATKLNIAYSNVGAAVTSNVN